MTITHIPGAECHYVEDSGTAAWVAQQIPFLARRVWIRAKSGAGDLEFSFGKAGPDGSEDYVTHGKLDSAGTNYPTTVELEFLELGCSLVAFKGNGIDFELRAWK